MRFYISLICLLFVSIGSFAAFAAGATIPVHSELSGSGVSMAFVAGGVNPDYIRELLVNTQRDPRFATQVAPGVWQPKYVIAAHTLRTITAVTNTVSSFEFKFYTGTDTPSSIDSRLGDNDVFIVAYMGMYLRAVVSSATEISRRQTYPNTLIFATDSTNFINGHLNVLYNGYIRFESQQVINFNKISALNFLYIPVAQEGQVNTDTGTSYQWANAAATTQYKTLNSDYTPGAGLYQLPGLVTLNGKRPGKWYLDINPGVTALKIDNTNSNTENYLEAELIGVIAFGAAPALG